jgi:hypothetical protein
VGKDRHDEDRNGNKHDNRCSHHDPQPSLASTGFLA